MTPPGAVTPTASSSISKPCAAVIGGGPAGLMAAEQLCESGADVTIFDAMASVGRKFLLAGKGGLNLTHAEPVQDLVQRYQPADAALQSILTAFDNTALRQWASALGIETFVGTSGRVFPSDLRAAPLLRAWLRRLRASGARFRMHHRWCGWRDDGALRFTAPDGDVFFDADAVVLALGGASWPRLGADGRWVPWLEACGVHVHPLKPANCGFDLDWSAHLREHFAGTPVKSIVASVDAGEGRRWQQRGEFVITANGIEGGVVYALSAALRDQVARDGEALLQLDLAPSRDREGLMRALATPHDGQSIGKRLKRAAGIDGVKSALLHEVLPKSAFADPALLVMAIKALPLRVLAPRPIDEAISTAGGVCLAELDHRLMLRRRPGVFCAGEMLDWEAPTGGFLLTGCFATGRAAGHGAVDWLRSIGRL